MSKHGGSLLKCPCGANRFHTTDTVNILRCFSCGMDHGITKTLRFQGHNEMDRYWEDWNEQCFVEIKKAQND